MATRMSPASPRSPRLESCSRPPSTPTCPSSTVSPGSCPCRRTASLRATSCWRCTNGCNRWCRRRSNASLANRTGLSAGPSPPGSGSPRTGSPGWNSTGPRNPASLRPRSIATATNCCTTCELSPAISTGWGPPGPPRGASAISSAWSKPSACTCCRSTSGNMPTATPAPSTKSCGSPESVPIIGNSTPRPASSDWRLNSRPPAPSCPPIFRSRPRRAKSCRPSAPSRRSSSSSAARRSSTTSSVAPPRRPTCSKCCCWPEKPGCSAPPRGSAG